MEKLGRPSTTRRGNAEIVEDLLNAGADPKKMDSQGVMATHVACYLGDVASLKLLLKAGADPDQIATFFLESIRLQVRKNFLP